MAMHDYLIAMVTNISVAILVTASSLMYNYLMAVVFLTLLEGAQPHPVCIIMSESFLTVSRMCTWHCDKSRFMGAWETKFCMLSIIKFIQVYACTHSCRSRSNSAAISVINESCLHLITDSPILSTQSPLLQQITTRPKRECNDVVASASGHSDSPSVSCLTTTSMEERKAVIKGMLHSYVLVR